MTTVSTPTIPEPPISTATPPTRPLAGNDSAHTTTVLDDDLVLKVENLDVRFDTEAGEIRAVDGASFEVRRGRTLGIVGESGCGKSVTAFSTMRIQAPGRIVGGRILFRDAQNRVVDICQMPDNSRALRSIRGGGIGMIFQEPMTALFPLSTVGSQMIEGILLHRNVAKDEARQIAIDLLGKVGIPSPEKRVDQYIHELSGGMRQRAVIAMALSCQPALLIADEPTTALDVTIQAQVLDLIRAMRNDTGAAVMLITHDLSVIAQEADDVAVMYLGRIVEYADVRTIVRNPRHPYTMGLLKSIPDLEHKSARLYQIKGDVPSLTDIPPGCPFHPRCEFALTGLCDVGTPPAMEAVDGGCHQVACLRASEIAAGKLTVSQPPKVGENIGPATTRQPAVTADKKHDAPLLEVRRLKKFFPIHSKGFLARKIGDVKASNDLTFTIRHGEVLGLVGESGCGKTTTARTILRALTPTSGQILFHTRHGEVVDLAQLTRKQLQGLRTEMQMIFQDPFSSLNPRMTVGSLVAEPLIINRLGTASERRDRVVELLRKVGLRPEHMMRYPHSFSGGQRQRIGIARALIMNPSLVVCDEAVSALDVSVQAQVINLLMDLQQEMDLTYIFVAHDLSVVKHICDRVAVMYAGSIVELGPVDTIFSDPVHPYTQGLLAAIPHLDPDRKYKSELSGEVLDIAKLPPGCPFQPRCKLATDACRNTLPELRDHDPFRQVACLHSGL